MSAVVRDSNSTSTQQTAIYALPSLSALIDEFTAVLENPALSGVAGSAAQVSVLGNVRAAFINQRQIPIPADTSAERGAFVALQHAAQRTAVMQVTLDGDLQPQGTDRVEDEQDKNGRLNPMRLFDDLDDLSFGLYEFMALLPPLHHAISDERLQQASKEATIAFVSVAEVPDWETWMDTFAR